MVINAGQMIVGGGEPPVKDVVVTVDNGVITSIGSASANGRTVIDVPDSVLMPGLVDPHTHVAS
ncbi:hypothetical protein G3I15_24415, partial [Streptomyces sp. SID10244]|nr:hypothetical protein [Streptomyces sp. SID10244]